MDDRLRGLAARLKAAIAAQDDAEAAARAADEARREAARAARRGLLDDLAAFGEALGTEVRRDGERVVLSWRGAEVVFGPRDDAATAEATWTADGVAHRVGIRRVDELDGKWFVAFEDGRRPPLLDAGLLRLLHEALDMPVDVPEEAAPAPAPRGPAERDL